jgi:short-subunit dehydrogenase
LKSIFENQWIWVTGASSGIGLALTELWYQRGAKLVISARSIDKLTAIQQSLNPVGDRIKVLPLDLADPTAMAAAAQQVLELTNNQIACLVNNGGVSQRALAMNTSLDVLTQMVKVNFLSQVELTRAVLPSMVQAKRGYIALTSSVAGKIGTKQRSGYAATKHALHGYFDSLREEHYQDGVHVCMVCPGYIKTDISLNALKADGSKNNQMDSGQETGMPVELLAQKMIAAIEGGKDEVYIGGKEVFGIYLKRYIPSLLKKVMRSVKYS